MKSLIIVQAQIYFFAICLKVFYQIQFFFVKSKGNSAIEQEKFECHENCVHACFEVWLDLSFYISLKIFSIYFGFIFKCGLHYLAMFKLYQHIIFA